MRILAKAFQGGTAGHKIDFISYDDKCSPPETVEQVRHLIDQDEVAVLFGILGRPTSTAILYQNDEFGKDYRVRVKDVPGKKYSATVVGEVTYETNVTATSPVRTS